MQRSFKAALGCAALWLLAASHLSARPAPQPATPDSDAPTRDEKPESEPAVSEKITVTANRYEVPLDSAGSSVTVIDRREIERRRKTTVAELLRTVPGLEVVRSAGSGSQTTAFLRGAASAHTLVLLDGVRLNSPSVGSFDLADLDTTHLERIEVLRGPQSTLYGSEAIGGVISIVTRSSADGRSWSALAEVGERSSRRLSAGLRGRLGRFDYGLALTDEATDGTSAAAGAGLAATLEADGHDRLTVSSRLGLALPREGRLDLSLRYVDAALDVDGFGPVDDPNARQLREALVASAGAVVSITERWRQTIRVGVHDEDLAGEDPDSPFNNFTTDTLTTEVSTQADVELGAGGEGSGVFSIGASFERREADVAGFGGYDEGSEIASLYGQYQWAWRDRLYLTAGLRRDDHSEFGGETTYRLTGSLAVAAATRLHASFGTGFRAPALNELFFPGFGNPELRPEVSEGFDVGLERRFLGERLRLDLTYFDNRFEDLIGFDASFRAVNVDRATSRGFELILDYDPGGAWALAASHTHDETEDLATGAQLARRPERRSTLRLSLQPTAALDGSLEVISVADRVETGGRPLEDYVRVDLALGYRGWGSFEPYLRVENLFDEGYQEILGFGTPGRTAAIGLRYRADR